MASRRQAYRLMIKSLALTVAHNLSSDRVPRGLTAGDVHIVFLDAQDYLC